MASALKRVSKVAREVLRIRDWLSKNAIGLGITGRVRTVAVSDMAGDE